VLNEGAITSASLIFLQPTDDTDFEDLLATNISTLTVNTSASIPILTSSQITTIVGTSASSNIHHGFNTTGLRWGISLAGIENRSNSGSNFSHMMIVQTI
jgi:hypothetical protein